MSDEELRGIKVPSTKRKHANDLRKRVSQACEACRNKKLKCEGSRPSCASCISLGRDCLYGSVVKKRGLPEGYVRGLEKLLALVSIEGNENVASIFEAALCTDSSKSELIRKWNGNLNGETLPELWRSSELCKALEKLLPDLEAVDGKGQDYKKPRLEPHAVNYPKDSIKSGDTTTLPLPSREDAEALFGIYFTYTHCWLPLVGKDEILAAYYRTLELSESCLSSGERASLWAILAYAQYQAPSKGHNIKDDTENIRIASQYYDKARALIPQEDSTLEAGHVQALLLLCLIKVRLGQMSAAWLLVGQAVNVAIDIGLNSPVSNGSIREKGVRIVLVSFYLDTMIATCLGRSTHMTSEDALRIGSVAEIGLEEWAQLDLGSSDTRRQAAPSRSLSVFNYLIQLIRLLNDSRRRIRSQEETFLKLNKWKTCFPAWCSIDKIQTSPHVLNLYISLSILLVIVLDQADEIHDFKQYADLFSIPAQVAEQLRTAGTELAVDSLPVSVYILNGLLAQSTEIQDKYLDPDVGLYELFSIVNSLCSKVRISKFSAGKKESLSSIVLDISRRTEVVSAAAPQPLLGGRSPLNFQFFQRSDDTVGEPAQLRGDSFLELKPRQISLNEGSDALSCMNTTHSWNASPEYVVMSNPSSTTDTIAMQEKVEDNISWNASDQNTYSAATNLFQFAQSHNAVLPVPALNNAYRLQAASTEPDNIDGVVDVNAVYPILQDPAYDDDLFFELSSLDYITGNRDETYRNLGFLLPTEADESSL